MAEDQVARELRNLSQNIGGLVTFLQDQAVAGGASPSAGLSQTESADQQKAAAERTRRLLSESTDGLEGLAATVAESIKINGESNKFLEMSVRDQTDMYASAYNDYKTGLLNRTEFETRIHNELGISLNGLEVEVEEMIPMLHLMADTHEESAEVVRDAALSWRDSLDQSGGGFGIAMKLFGAVAIEAAEVAKASAKSGAEATLMQAVHARALGMSQAELLEMNGQSLQVMGAAGQTVDDFNAKMTASSWEMARFTGSLESGAKMYQQQMLQARLVGVESETGLERYNNIMNESAKELNISFGVTTDELVEMNAQMIDSAGIQRNLYKLHATERKQVMEGIQKRRLELMSMGLFAKQADSLMTSINDLIGGGNTELGRQEEMAKLASVMGGMGMGSEGQRIMEIMAMAPQDRAKADAELQGIIAKAALQNSDFMANASAGERASREAMLEFTSLLGADAESARIATQAALAQEETAREQKRRMAEAEGRYGEIKGAIVTAADIATGLSKGNVERGVIAAFEHVKFGEFLAGIGGGIGGMLGSALGSVAGGITSIVAAGGSLVGMASGLMGTLASGLGAAAGAASTFALPLAGIAAAGAGGWMIGTQINDAINKHLPEFGDAIGGTVHGMVEAGKGALEEMGNAVDHVGGFVDHLSDQSIGEILGGSADYWGDKIGGLFGGDEEETTAIVPPMPEVKKMTDALKNVTPTAEQIKLQAEEKAAADKLMKDMIGKLGEQLGAAKEALRLKRESMAAGERAASEQLEATVNAAGTATNAMPVM